MIHNLRFLSMNGDHAQQFGMFCAGDDNGRGSGYGLGVGPAAGPGFGSCSLGGEGIAHGHAIGGMVYKGVWRGFPPECYHNGEEYSYDGNCFELDDDEDDEDDEDGALMKSVFTVLKLIHMLMKNVFTVNSDNSELNNINTRLKSMEGRISDVEFWRQINNLDKEAVAKELNRRIFARFDKLDESLKGMEFRLESLEICYRQLESNNEK